MLRRVLVGLVVAATAGFVAGTTIERHNSRHESAAQRASETGFSNGAPTGESVARRKAEGGQESTGETPAQHAASGARTTASEVHKEIRPLGVDVEAVPFVVLAALASLGLAALAWARQRWLPGLVSIVLAMTVFGALDLREVFHQADENRTGLVLLAIMIAAMHFAAAGVALAMSARRKAPGPAAATMHG